MRFAPLFLVPLLSLILACSDDPPSSQQASSTPVQVTTETPRPPATATMAPWPTPWPELDLAAIQGTTIADAGAYVLDTETGALSYLGELGGIFSPDGTRIASRLCCLGAGFVDILDIASRRTVRHATGDVTDLAWSPDSNWIAFVVNQPPDQAGVHVVDRDGRNARRLTNQVGAIVWLDAGRIGLYYGEDTAYFVIDLATGAVQELVRMDPLTAADPRIVFGTPSPSGQWVLYREAESFSVWSTATGGVHDLNSVSALWSPAEDRLLLSRLVPDQPYPTVSVLDPATMAEIALRDAGRAASWTNSGQVASIRHHCAPPLGSGGGTGDMSILLFDPRSGASRQLVPPPSDGGNRFEMSPSPVRPVAAFTQRVSGLVQLVQVDVTSGQQQVRAEATGGDGLHVHGQWSSDGRYVQFRLGGDHGICD